MESFGRLGKEGGDLIDQVAASIVGGTDGSSFVTGEERRLPRTCFRSSRLPRTCFRSSLVQLYLGSFMRMDLRVLLLLQSRTKEYNVSPTNAKNRFMKNKDSAFYCKCCNNYTPAVSLRVSLLCFLHGTVFGSQTLWIHVFV